MLPGSARDAALRGSDPTVRISFLVPAPVSVSATPSLFAFILRAYGCFLDGSQGTSGLSAAGGERGAWPSGFPPKERV